MKPGLTVRKLLAFGLLAASGAAAAAGAPYPVKPVRYVVPFAPGGPTDLMSRAIGEKVAEAWGQQVVVDNRGGAGGTLGAEVVARSAPDGYTVMIGHTGTHATSVALYPRLGYDPVRDFTPITLMATLPLALVVHAGVPARSVKELIEFAQARPGTINFASAGNGGPTHLAAELFRTLGGIAIVHVPYKGNAAALTELVGGQVQMMFSNLLTAMPHVKSGRLRALGISSAKRSPSAPELPTIAESGLPGFDMAPWYGLLGPAGLPREIVTKWNAEVARVIRLPDLQQRFVTQGVDLASSTPDAFGALIRSEVPKWSQLVKQVGAKID